MATINSFHKDSGPYNHAVLAVERIEDDGSTEIVGVIREPIIKTYCQPETVFISSLPDGSQQKEHPNWEDAISRFA